MGLDPVGIDPSRKNSASLSADFVRFVLGGLRPLAVKARASAGGRIPVLPPVGRAGRVIPLTRRRP
jgi:hypothetical protein